MQTWAKRGIQTALVTGGLMMLGTGIAAADDNIHPDTPPSALDATVKVPIKIDENAIGTPLGDRHLPGVEREITVAPGQMVKQLPMGQQVTGSLPRTALSDEDDLFRGNKVVGNVVAPVKITGNAIAVLGDAAVVDQSSQHVSHTQDVHTDGSNRGLAGNVVNLAYGLPIDVSGNAVSAGGTATTINSSEQSAVADGDITTDGDNGALSGNVAAVHGATPVQLTGNSVAAAGVSTAISQASSHAKGGGTIETSGEDGAISGNAAGAPVALPARVSGNSIAKLGIAESLSSATTTAQAGDQQPDIFGVPAYIETDGSDGATVSGNALQTPVSGPVAVDCNGVADISNTASLCETTTDSAAGGGTRTFGDDSVLSGSIGSTPVALPVQGQANCGSLVGNCETVNTNTVTSDAGGDGYTRGHDSVIGGSTATVPVTGPVDLCGNVAGAVGSAETLCQNTSTTEAGGNTGTTGDDSVGGGNNGSVPVALPVEGLGNTAGAIGDAEAAVVENKTSTSGGGNNTNDDAAVGAANLVTVPVAGPVQVFSNGVGAVANTHSEMAGVSDVTAGGPSQAKGTLGTLSGNIAQAPVAVPTQIFGAGATAVGNGVHAATNSTTSTSGGDAVTDGTDGNISGNLLTAPVASTVQFFGDSVAVAGDDIAVADNATTTTAGGDGLTSGQFGNLSGNILAPQALVIGQGFGNGVAAVAGDATGVGINTTDAHSGGDLFTNGDEGHLSGNILDVPAAAVAQVHGNAVAALGAQAIGVSDNVTTGSVGGVSETTGDSSDLSGIDGDIPIDVEVPIYDVPIEVLAEAIAEGNHFSDIAVGEEESGALDLPRPGGLEVTKLPALPSMASLPFPGGYGMSRSGLPMGGLVNGGMSLPTDHLTEMFSLPGGMARSGLPVGGLLGGGADLPTDDLTEVLDLGGLPGGMARTDLPTDGPLGGGANLPTDQLTEVLDLRDLVGGGADLPTDDLTEVLDLGGLPGGMARTDHNPYPETLPEALGFALSHSVGDGLGLNDTSVDELGTLTGPAGVMPRSADPMSGLLGGDALGAVNPLGQLGGAGNPLGQLGGAGNPLEQLGGAGNPLGQLGGAGNPLGQLGGAGNPLEQLGGAANPLEQLGGAGNPMQQVSGGVAMPLEQLGGGTNPLDAITVGGQQLGGLDDIAGATPRSSVPMTDPVTDVMYLVGSVNTPQLDDVSFADNVNTPHTYEVNGFANPTGHVTQTVADMTNLPTPAPVTPRTAAPAMPGLDSVPGLDNLEGAFTGNLVHAPSLDRLPVQTPALSGLDTATALPAADSSSLADTQSRLTGLVGHSPIG